MSTRVSLQPASAQGCRPVMHEVMFISKVSPSSTDRRAPPDLEWHPAGTVKGPPQATTAAAWRLEKLRPLLAHVASQCAASLGMLSSMCRKSLPYCDKAFACCCLKRVSASYCSCVSVS